MAELNDKELQEINAGVATPKEEELSGIGDFFKKIGKNLKAIAKPVFPSIR